MGRVMGPDEQRLARRWGKPFIGGLKEDFNYLKTCPMWVFILNAMVIGASISFLLKVIFNG